MKKLLALSVLPLALVLSSCASQNPSGLSTTFIGTVRDEYPTLRLGDDDLISLADTACDAFDSGASFYDVVGVLFESGGDIATEMAFAIGAGVPIYCPEHTSKIKRR